MFRGIGNKHGGGIIFYIDRNTPCKIYQKPPLQWLWSHFNWIISYQIEIALYWSLQAPFTKSKVFPWKRMTGLLKLK